jgi:lysophospholipase L1-like esterase
MRARVLSVLALVAVNLLLFGLLEAGVRLYASTRAGTPVLWYGTDWYRNRRQLFEAGRQRAQERAARDTPDVHAQHVGDYRPYDAEGDGTYSKYVPGEVKRLTSEATGETVTVRINSHGFRGRDFGVEKPAGVVRVVTLGGSSTFGFGVGDDETYPAQLERVLNQRSGGAPRYEVVNFGVPHSTSSNILAMFLAEGLPLDPDVVTFYEGANDAAIDDESVARSPAWRWLRERVLLLELGDRLVASVLPSRVLWSEEWAALRSRRFLANLERLREACAANGVRLIVATQQTRSLAIPRERLREQRIGYDDEVARVERFLSRPLPDGRSPQDVWRTALQDATAVSQPVAREGAADDVAGKLTEYSTLDKARVFLIHARLMRDMRAWAAERGVELADLIAALDADRGEIFSWVHLTPAGNRKAAEALADQILARPAGEVR